MGQKTWVLASHNPGKIKELEQILSKRGVTLRSARDLALPEPDETESTFRGNAALKAQAACEAIGLPCLADDSGLSVDALDGEPGIYSARWAGEPRDFMRAMKRVDQALRAAGSDDRTARFICIIALARPGEETVFFEGEVRGEIVWPPRGPEGFGYDPIFQPAGHDRTFGEMTADEKRALSHRARALDAMIAVGFQ